MVNCIRYDVFLANDTSELALFTVECFINYKYSWLYLKHRERNFSQFYFFNISAIRWYS